MVLINKVIYAFRKHILKFYIQMKSELTPFVCQAGLSYRMTENGRRLFVELCGFSDSWDSRCFVFDGWYMVQPPWAMWNDGLD